MDGNRGNANSRGWLARELSAWDRKGEKYPRTVLLGRGREMLQVRQGQNCNQSQVPLVVKKKKKKTLLPMPAIKETRVRSLGQEDSAGGGHGNPLQYLCLEIPMDRGA